MIPIVVVTKNKLFLCRFIGKLYFLLLTFLIDLSEMCMKYFGLNLSQIK